MSETCSNSLSGADWPIDLYPRRRPLVFVISGPSGVGKDAIIDGLKDGEHQLHHVITATTRARRETEIPGVHYHFLTPAEFARLRDNGDLLESANVYGYEYGTPRQQILDALGAGKDVILKIDVQGARQVKMRMPEAVFIFIGPSSLEELAHRLRRRGTERADNLQTRVDTARAELRDVKGYDYIVVNREGRLAEAVAEIKAIMQAERLRVTVRDCDLG